MLNSFCPSLNRAKRYLLMLMALLLPVSSAIPSIAVPCNNSPVFLFSQALYASHFELAQSQLARIHIERSAAMGDFLQQVLHFMRAYESGQESAQNAALDAIDALITRVSGELDKAASEQSRLDAGNIMIHAARLHLLRGHILRSARLAKAGYLILNAVLEQSPQQVDAYLSVGLYQYFSANENNAWGWIKDLLSLQGDKLLGRDYLERAVKASADDAFEAARSVMMDLHWDRPDTCRYAQLFTQLQDDMLKTIEHRQRSIAAQLFCGQPAAAIEDIQQLRALISQNMMLASEAQSNWLFEANLQGMAALGKVSELEKLLHSNASSYANHSALIKFSLARALDVRGQRQQAREMYAQVERSNAANRYRKLAVIYQKQAYAPPRAYQPVADESLRFACSGHAD